MFASHPACQIPARSSVKPSSPAQAAQNLPSQGSHANITLKGGNRLRRGLTPWVGEKSLRLPAPAWERKLVLLLQFFGSSFIGYTRAVPGHSCWFGSEWDLLSQPWEFAMGFLVVHRDSNVWAPSLHQQTLAQEDRSFMFSVVGCLECKWCLCTEMPSVAFLCHKSAPLFLGLVQSSVCAASWDKELHS